MESSNETRWAAAKDCEFYVKLQHPLKIRQFVAGRRTYRKRRRFRATERRDNGDGTVTFMACVVQGPGSQLLPP